METYKSRLALPPGSWQLEAATADFERFGAADYIAEIRLPEEPDLPVDWHATLAGLNATVHYEPLGSSGMLKGNKYTPKIWVDSRDPACRQNMTIGHEVGHHFLLHIEHLPPAAAGDVRAYVRQEAFCDYFAHRLIGRPACLAATLDQ